MRISDWSSDVCSSDLRQRRPSKMLAVQNPCPVAIDTLAIAKLDPLVWGERRHPTPVQSDDYRRPSEVDYARVIHSESFRRLQGKTQILSISDSDFHRKIGIASCRERVVK